MFLKFIRIRSVPVYRFSNLPVPVSVPYYNFQNPPVPVSVPYSNFEILPVPNRYIIRTFGYGIVTDTDIVSVFRGMVQMQKFKNTPKGGYFCIILKVDNYKGIFVA